MKAHEFFGALVRVLGLWEIVSGLASLPTLIAVYRQAWGAPRAVYGQAVESLASTAGAHVLIGFVLFCCANWIVRLAYARDAVRDPRDGNNVDSLPSLPPGVKTALLLAVAIVLWVANGALAQGNLPPAVARGTLHTTLIIAIGCAAVAYLLRRHRRPLDTFLIAWIVSFGAAVTFNSIRL
jgi:hypothetical protein